MSEASLEVCVGFLTHHSVDDGHVHQHSHVGTKSEELYEDEFLTIIQPTLWQDALLPKRSML